MIPEELGYSQLTGARFEPATPVIFTTLSNVKVLKAPNRHRHRDSNSRYNEVSSIINVHK